MKTNKYMKTTFDLEEIKTDKYISSIDYKLILIKVLVRAWVRSLTLESWLHTRLNMILVNSMSITNHFSGSSSK